MKRMVRIRNRWTAGLLLLALILALFPGCKIETPEERESNVSLMEGGEASGDENTVSCLFSIRCDTILDNLDLLDKAYADYVPEDGAIYAQRRLMMAKGSSAYDALAQVTAKNRIQMSHQSNPLYKSEYIQSIGHLYEGKCGEGSGWMYKVNGAFPNYGSSRYVIKEGDTIEWVYTCNLGYDLGRTGDWDSIIQGGEEPVE